MNAAAPSCCWRWRRARNCTTSARARRSATGAGRRAACCGRGDRDCSDMLIRHCERSEAIQLLGLQESRIFDASRLSQAMTIQYEARTMNQKNLLEVDWSKIPAPSDDGAAAHLVGMTIPPLSLVATDDTSVTLSALPGRTVVFAYPRTGEPGKIALVDDWDMIPGARGCTPQTCAFRDLFAELKAAGAAHVFGLSTQSNEYQTEMAGRLHLPFPVLSDEKLALTSALALPTMHVAGLTLIKRLALIIDGARISQVFYPVFPPDRNAGDVLAWLKENPV